MPEFKDGDVIRYNSNVAELLNVKGTAVVDGVEYYIIKREWRTPFLMKADATDVDYVKVNQYKAGQIYHGSGHWFIVAAPDRMARLYPSSSALWDSPEHYEKEYGPLALYEHVMLNG